jgi:uncharacterized protein (TIGR02145 family)
MTFILISMKKLFLIFPFLALFSFSNKAQTVTDIDGNVYHTVTIGTQVWMVENLKTTKYNDGASIPLITDSAMWVNLTTQGYCWYNNEPDTYKNTYGALYNWSVVNTGKLGPTGWHVPTSAEWDALATYLGGDYVAGGKMKSTGTIETGTGLWYSPNTNATNESGFTAVPAGGRKHNGTFSFIGYGGFLWSSSEGNEDNAWYRGLYSIYNPLFTYYSSKSTGFSVRCVRDYGSGIDQINNRNKIKIYPNPAIDNINIDFTGNNRSGTLTIYDLMGKIVRQKEIEQIENAIDISSLTKGVYIIEISDSRKVLQSMLIKR